MSKKTTKTYTNKFRYKDAIAVVDYGLGVIPFVSTKVGYPQSPPTLVYRQHSQWWKLWSHLHTLGLDLFSGSHPRLISWSHQVHLGDGVLQPWAVPAVIFLPELSVHYWKLLSRQLAGECWRQEWLSLAEDGCMGVGDLQPCQGGHHRPPDDVFRGPTENQTGVSVTAADDWG